MRITVIGSSNIDMCANVPHLPCPGETITALSYNTAYGGKGANQAVAARRLGAEVSFITSLGNDSHGKELLKHFSNEGINTSGIITIPGQTTGVALITIDHKGENTIAVCPGANGDLTPDRLEPFIDLITSADIVVMQAEIPYATVKKAAHIASAAGVPVLYNPAPICNVDEEMMQMVDILVVNEDEGSTLAGCKATNEEIAKALARKGAKNVVITLGSKGAYAFNGEQGITVPSFKVKAIDTVGAGDTFCGALAVEYAKRHRIDPGSLTFASAAAALAVTRHGAQPAIPTLRETLDFLATQGLTF